MRFLIGLLRKKKPLVEAPPDPVADPQPTLSPEYGRIFLLIPEGAYTYRLVVFADVKSTAIYVDAHVLPEQSILAFWARNPEDPKGRSPSGEALVLAAEEGRLDIVRPYSFLDVEAARSFLAEGSGASDAERLLLFWGEPVTIPRGLTVPATGPTPRTPQRQTAAVRPQSAPSPAMGTVASGVGAMAASAVLVSDAEVGAPGFMSRVADWPGWEGLGPRMVAACQARKAIYYDAVDDDPYADGRAGLIVVIGAFSAGIAAMGGGVSAPIWHFAGATAGWLLSVTAVHLVAMAVLGRKRPAHSYRRLAVALGLAYSPAIFLMLGAVPVYGPLFTLAILGWLAVTAVVAVETALETDRENALVMAIAGWLFLFAFALVVPQLLT